MEKVWLNSYPADVPETLNVDYYHSLNEMFEAHFSQFKKKPAFINFGVSLTYESLEQLSTHFAAFLQKSLHQKKGDRFAIMLPNILQFPVAMFGALRAGLIVTNVNPLYTSRELATQLKDSGATTIIVLENFLHELVLALPHTKIQHVIVTKIGDGLGLLKGSIANFIAKFKRLVPAWELARTISYKNALKIGSTLQFEKVNLVADDVAFLQYTGGTTGVPKGAMLTHRNMVANVTQCLAWVKSTLTPGKEIVLTALPLYHIFSLTVCCFCFMALGSECLLITNPRDLNAFIRTIKKNPPSIFVGLNTLFKGLLHHKKFSTLRLSSLKLVIAGGMAMQKVVAEEWQQRTGKVIIEGYGLTEASPVVSINPLNLKSYNGSIGLPIPDTDVTICDDSGALLDLGKSGELCVRGPQVMLGYWQNPKETALVLNANGWLRTGDIAKIDERGFIYLLDRKKDMIIVSGFNVYPNEVEATIAQHPGVLEVAVVGVPSEKSGEMVKAFIVKQDQALTKEDIIQFCHERLTPYKIPKEIEFRDTLPKSAVGKILRRSLKEASA